LDCVVDASSVALVPTHLQFRPSDWPHEDGRCHEIRWPRFEVSGSDSRLQLRS
jgi:hypothetical protein